MSEPRKLKIGGARKSGAAADGRVVYHAGDKPEQPDMNAAADAQAASAARAAEAAQAVASARQTVRARQTPEPTAEELYQQAVRLQAQRIAEQKRQYQQQVEAQRQQAQQRAAQMSSAARRAAAREDPLPPEVQTELQTLNGIPLVMPSQAQPRQLQDTTGALYDQQELRAAQQRYLQQRRSALQSGYDPDRLARIRGQQQAAAQAAAPAANGQSRTVRTVRTAQSAVPRPAQPAPRKVSQTEAVYSAAAALAAGGRQQEAPARQAQNAPAQARTIRRAPAQAPAQPVGEELNLQEVVGQEASVNKAPQASKIHRAGAAASTPKGGNGGGKPPKGGKSGGGDGGKPPKGGKNGKDGGKGGKPAKKKGRWWKILLATLLVLALIFGGTIAVIWHAVAPAAGSITLSQLINTPKEYQGDYLNIVVAGIDWEEDRADMYSETANDGMTDMIMYVNFDFVEGKVNMLQIPRNTLITTDYSVSANYQINAVARTQGENGNSDVGALCNMINEQWGLPVDGYITINMQSLKEIVDMFGGVEVYVPHDISYGGSTLTQGYQTLDGDAADFFVRNRKGEGYENSDIDRLNMQRYFYSGLFRRLKTMTAWDVAKLLPVIMSYMETSLNVSDVVSVGVSLLQIDSSNIMLCQMPVYLGVPYYNGNSVVAAARQEDADLLNQYFRGNMGAVDASELGDCFDIIDTAGYTATDPNVQYMGSLNDEAATAQQTENLDGSNTVTYVDPTPTPAPTAEAG